MMNGSMMSDSSMMGMMCLMMGFVVLLIVIAVAVATYVVARSLMRKCKVEDRPLMILRERYVRGEINDEEFEHKQAFLKK